MYIFVQNHLKMKRLLWLYFYLFLFINTGAQKQDFNFTRVSPPGGLNFQHIHSLTQDAEGNIWMGSNQGIYKYNPIGFQRFNHDPNNPKSLRNDIVNQLLIDQNNKLWVATNSGIDLFNKRDQSFIHFNYANEDREIQNHSVQSFAFDKDQRFWIIDDMGLGCLDTLTRKIKYVSANHLKSRPHLIYFDKTGLGWVGTFEGSVYKFNPQKKTLVKIIEGPGSYPHTIFIENDKIYVGYQSHGASVFSNTGELIKKFEYKKEKKWDLKNTSVRTIIRDNNQNLWIGAYSGLFMEEDGDLIRINSKYHHTVLNKSIYSIFKDRSGKLWFGAWSGGLFYLNEHGNDFKNYHYSKTKQSISDNTISSFIELNDGSLLVGTEVGGLNKFDPVKETFESIEINEELKPVNIKTLARDKNNTIWVGTFREKLWYKKIGENKFTQIRTSNFPGFPETVEHVYAVEPCAKGVWIGTFGNGVFFYNYSTETISALADMTESKNLDHLQHVRSLYYDSNDNLWIGSNFGISRVKLNSEYKGIVDFSSQLGTVYFINEINTGEIYVGTKAIGIRAFRTTKDSVVLLDSVSLFSGKDVYGFIQDQDKNLWVTTNSGIYLYDKRNNSIRMFNEVDGIQGNQFNPQAIFQNSQGNLFFGGTNGFTVVNPRNVKINPRPPKSMITKIIVNNKREIFPLYNPAISSYEPLEFSPNENSFNLEFSCDNYLLPQKNHYKYRLAGMYEEWISNETNNNAVFTNIPPGEYIFEVKAANNDGIWSDHTATISIKIPPPWWKSSPAFAIYLAIFIAISWLIYKARKERINLKKAILIERIKHEHEEHLHESKLRFFTNISHEIRTPLTLIAGSLSSVFEDYENLTSRTADKLKVIQRNTDRLLALINQLLDFRKLENGAKSLMLTQFYFGQFIQNCFNYFVEEAKEKNVLYQMKLEKDFLIEADEEKLDKVFVNLLSNSFKYTPKSGKISVIIDEGAYFPGAKYGDPLKLGELLSKDLLQISIIDTGTGISSKHISDIFERFEKGAGQEWGSGLGLSICKEFILLHQGEILISSKPGSGTCISVRLPLKQSIKKVPNNTQLTNSAANSSDFFSDPIKPVISAKNDGTKYKILIVDDNEEMLQFLSSILTPHYQIKICSDGKQALSLIQEHNYDLVLSDVMMPETNGFELCSKIKSEEETSHIPVVLLTALSSENSHLNGLSKGADDYITKPFKNNLLISRIGNLLKQREDLKNSFEYRFLNNNKEMIFREKTPENFFLKKVTDIIEENLTNSEFGVESLSKEIGMSRGNLHRKMKQLTNRGPNEYIRMIKLKKAADLLKSGEYNVEEIVFKLGFNSSSYFIKCFKSVYNETPKQFMTSQMVKGKEI